MKEFMKLNWLPVEAGATQLNLCVVRSIMNGFAPNYLLHYSTSHRSERLTGTILGLM